MFIMKIISLSSPEIIWCVLKSIYVNMQYLKRFFEQLDFHACSKFSEVYIFNYCAEILNFNKIYIRNVTIGGPNLYNYMHA